MLTRLDASRTLFASSVLVCVFSSPAVRVAVAADAAAAARPDEAGKPLQLQPGDDELLPLNPVRPRTPDDQSRLDAVSWYMTGRLRESRNDFRGALDAYKKAAELDPTAVQVYRALVPLAFSLNLTDDAVGYAIKAVELDPSDYRLLRQLGVHMATQGNVPKAVELLEKAARSTALDKQSSAYVSLMRDLALLYSATGQPDKAADSYQVVFDARVHPDRFDLDPSTREALQRDPRTSFERIGQAFLDAKRPESAIDAFQRASKERDGRAGALNFNLAQVYLQTEKFDQALEELQVYLDAQLQSKGRAAYQLLADILGKMDRSDELIDRLEKLAEKDPKNATLQYYLAEQYVAADRLDDAEAQYRKTLEETGDVRAHVGLAGVYRRGRRPAELIDALAKAASGGQDLEHLSEEMELLSKDKELTAELLGVGRKRLEGKEGELDFAAGYLLAKLAAEIEQSDDAVLFYRFAIKSRGDRAAPLFEELGRHLLGVDKFAEAAEVFREALANPALAENKASFLFMLSQALELAGDTKAALESIQEARKSLPDNPLLHFQEGWVHYHARQWEKAIGVFEQVIADYPQSKEIVRRAQFSLSNIYVQQGDMRKGEKILEDVYAEDPDDPSVNNDLGYLYADQGKNLEQAEKMIRKALDAEPENAAYLDSMGWVLFKLGKVSEAIPYLEKAIAKPSGADPTILDHLGDCHHRVGQSEKARELWQRALEKARADENPDAKLIQSIEAKLKGE